MTRRRLAPTSPQWAPDDVRVTIRPTKAHPVIPYGLKTDGAGRIVPRDGLRKWQRFVNARIWAGMPRATSSPAYLPETPLRLDVLVIRARIQDFEAKRHPDGLVPCVAKPDEDNLAKAIQDAMMREEDRSGRVLRRALVQDDNQVMLLCVAKAYAERGAPERVLVRIRPIRQSVEGIVTWLDMFEPGDLSAW